jgi:hypothetical protein
MKELIMLAFTVSFITEAMLPENSGCLTKDDTNLLFFVTTYGQRWNIIANYIPTKTPEQLSSRYLWLLSNHRVEDCDGIIPPSKKCLDIKCE